VKSNREVHLDATPALLVDLNASEQITNSKPPHPNAPYFSPLEMPSPDFQSVRPLRFTPTWPTPLVLPSHKPLGWHYALPLYWPSIAGERIDSKKWPHAFEKIYVFIHEVMSFLCVLDFFDSFPFNCLLIFTSSHLCVGQSWEQGEPCYC
jgi:hypothetical protein